MDNKKIKECGCEPAGEKGAGGSVIVFEKSGWLPVLGSLVIPGLGQFMRGQVLIGIAVFMSALAVGLFTYGLGYFGLALPAAIWTAYSSIPKCSNCKCVVSAGSTKCCHCQADLVGTKK